MLCHRDQPIQNVDYDPSATHALIGSHEAILILFAYEFSQPSLQKKEQA